VSVEATKMCEERPHIPIRDISNIYVEGDVRLRRGDVSL
jgi:hypothetical protein